MRAKGMGYDTGFTGDGVTLRPLDPDVVRREIGIIKDDLHCTAIRIIGNDLDHIDLAAGFAADVGLEVWYSPYPYEATAGEAHDLLLAGAERAERLRARGTEVVFVAGAELSLFSRGFLAGDSLVERVAHLHVGSDESRAELAALPGRVNAFLARTVAEIRGVFGGRVTYASIPPEHVDWTPFDIVSADAHRSKAVADVYAAGIRHLVAQGKPVAITEYGCATYRGAADDGAGAAFVVTYEDGVPVGLDGDYVRDEEEQARCLAELYEVFEAEGVDAAFVCTFILWHLPHRDDPRTDLDAGSYGVVKVLESGTGTTYPGLPWEPKAAFATVGELYGSGG
jgi:hypothetical protein